MESEKMYMNPHTGSVDTLQGWAPHTPESAELCEVIKSYTGFTDAGKEKVLSDYERLSKYGREDIEVGAVLDEIFEQVADKVIDGAAYYEIPSSQSKSGNPAHLEVLADDLDFEWVGA